MQTKYYKCPECGQTNKVQLPENFEDKVQTFLERAPATTAQGLLSLGLGVFIAAPVGLAAAAVMLATAIYNDGTAKCANCSSRFRIVD